MLIRRSRVVLLALSLLTVAACGGGGGGNGSGSSPRTVTVSGTANYEFVPPSGVCSGLDFAATAIRPIRGATVQLLSSTDAVLGTTRSADNGSFSFSGIAPNTQVRLRVRAELKQQGTPSWDVEIRDNYDASATPPARALRPLYVLDGASFSTGTTNVSRTVTATTGWDGAGYTGTRAAAPFAILDTIYAANQYVLQADATAIFPPLDVFWSVNNTVTISSTGLTRDEQVDVGELGGSFYRIGSQEMFLVGDASSDTEEFDDHVIVHEWSHYFEDTFSRSDNKGGSHNIGESLEASFAFSEGWGYAIGALVTDNVYYCDTGRPGTSAGFGLQTETGEYGVPGWFNEWGIGTVIYDLVDTNDDGTDTSSIGWPAVYNTMIGAHASSEAFTTIFSFAAELRSSLNPADQAFLDSQLDREAIVSGTDLDIWATNETNDAGVPSVVPRNVAETVLPLYIDYTADGTPLNVCMDSYLDGFARDGNNIGQDLRLRIAVPVTDQYSVTMTATTALPPDDPLDASDQSDPDFYIYRRGQELVRGVSATANTETATTPTLQAGTTYVAYLEEWRFQDENAPNNYPARMCFDVSFTPTP
jgi:hypothetical protein